jgi:hypothetical protein
MKDFTIPKIWNTIQKLVKAALTKQVKIKDWIL